MKPAATKGARSEPAVAREATSGKSMSDDAQVLGPLPCIACGQTVLWVRQDDGRWRLVQGGVAHKCPEAA